MHTLVDGVLCLVDGYPWILPAYPERVALAPRLSFCQFASAAEHYKSVHLVHR